VRVTIDKTQIEHNESADPSIADIGADPAPDAQQAWPATKGRRLSMRMGIPCASAPLMLVSAISRSQGSLGRGSVNRAAAYVGAALSPLPPTT
jgi:hypothetical protein